MRKLLVIMILALIAAMPAWAEAEKDTPKVKVLKGEGNTPNLLMEEVKIQGELERPDVFYIIPRRKARMDLGSLSKNYEAEIMEPILPGPFEARYSDVTDK